MDASHPMMKRFVRTLKSGKVKLNATKVRTDAILPTRATTIGTTAFGPGCRLTWNKVSSPIATISA